MSNTATFFISALHQYFKYTLPFSAEDYNKFKELCVAYADEEDSDYIDLEELAEWCEETQDDSWFSSDDALQLRSDIFNHIVNLAVNGEFGELNRTILYLYEDMYDEHPELDDASACPSTEVAIEFFNLLEEDYSPLFELAVTSL